MPTCRIDAWESKFRQLVADGHKPEMMAMSTAIKEAVGRVLGEELSGVEGRWNPPFDDEIADNTCPYTVDILFSKRVTRKTMKKLAEAVLKVFDDSFIIVSGDEYGVWIVTPHGAHWDQRKKP